MERISIPKNNVTRFLNPNNVMPPHNDKSINAYNSDWWLLWLLNANPPRKKISSVTTIEICVNSLAGPSYKYMLSYFRKKLQSGI